MNKLILGSLCIAGAAACTNGVGHIFATWQLANVDSTGGLTAASCPAGFDTAELHTVAASPDGLALDACTSVNSDCYIDLFNCSDGSGRSSALPAQNYLTWIQIASHDGTQVYAISDQEFVDITSADQNFDTTILKNGGYFRLSWSLMGESSGAPLSCSQTAASSAAGGSVETTAIITGGQTALADKFNCEDHFGYSAPLPSGSYTVLVDARDSTDTPLSSQPVTLPGELIGLMANDINDLGHVVITIAGQ